MDDAVDPVHRFRISTRDEAETEEFIRQIYVGNRMRFLGSDRSARFTATVAEHTGIAAGEVRSNVDYNALTDPFDHYVFLSIRYGRLRVVNGCEETLLHAGDNYFYPLGSPLDVELFDMGVRTLQLPATRMAQTAEQTAGIRPADLRFDSTRPISTALARQWTALVNLTSAILLSDDAPAPDALLSEELTRTAAITALHVFPNSALTGAYRPGPGWVGAAPVRRAAAFIQAHADQPLTLEQIAVAAGIGGRALQYAFRRHVDATPIGYLRRIRLERAAQELRDADPANGVTVATVARRWGWASARQFAAAYRRRFGVLPSHTLRK
ncbi:AraC family transcriptional regulator [Cryptosporangium sp. NPDC051539]|uniref:AraC family transcriptional regulator n=1 Tax=Cryptosporangium sp. NPDC051539 TaxID=3363962 RepID=UPI0037B195AB